MMQSLKSRATERPVADAALFFVFTFLITWGTGMVLVFSTHASMVNGAHPVEHPIPLPLTVAIVLALVGGFGPFLAATAVAALRGGRSEIRGLFRQFVRWRVHPVWYLVALLGPALLGFMALCATALSGGSTPAHWFSRPRAVWFAGWAFGPWGEELGWRGFAQPKLQKRLGALGASLVVGAMWSLWHYWPVATPAGGSFKELVQAPFATWLTYELANSVMMAWLYNSSGGSLPIAWAAHVGLSLGQNLVDKHPIPFGSFVTVFCIAAALVTAFTGPRTLSRGAPHQESR